MARLIYDITQVLDVVSAELRAELPERLSASRTSLEISNSRSLTLITYSGNTRMQHLVFDIPHVYASIMGSDQNEVEPIIQDIPSVVPVITVLGSDRYMISRPINNHYGQGWCIPLDARYYHTVMFIHVYQ